MKLIINTCYGGFRVSHKGYLAYAKRKGFKLFVGDWERNGSDWQNWKIKILGDAEELQVDDKEFAIPIHYFKVGTDGELEAFWLNRSADRTDPDLIAVVEELGDEASNWASKLKIVEIPDGIDWEIDEYDGIETVRERSRSWG